MLGLCDRYLTTQITSAGLRAKLNKVAAMIKRTSEAGYFGEFLQTQCDGQTNNGMCVNITDITTTNGSVRTAIPWMQQLYDIAETLAKHEKAATLWKKAQHAIASKCSTVQRILYAEPIPEPEGTTVKGMEDKNKEVNRDQKELECEAIQKPAECKSNETCKWEGDETDGKNANLMKQMQKNREHKQNKTKILQNATTRQHKNAEMCQGQF
ncbi:Trypanosomal VSG domain containing protein [Trypanosoma brucei equiperdum]|uniref:Trypanosomal VSG domain containing protein n=1 Tax=Trypanosoma brucei equiperdum TaxID=630700 RepID=A0A3L6LEG6_9TRYP|nr:Trypanosomal VSG domain containing protein [Trypanosoma brucei equiperdum]